MHRYTEPTKTLKTKQNNIFINLKNNLWTIIQKGPVKCFSVFHRLKSGSKDTSDNLSVFCLDNELRNKSKTNNKIMPKIIQTIL